MKVGSCHHCIYTIPVLAGPGDVALLCGKTLSSVTHSVRLTKEPEWEFRDIQNPEEIPTWCPLDEWVDHETNVISSPGRL